MTGYHIRIGYNSHMNGDDKRAAFDVLRDVVAACRSPSFVAAEAWREVESRHSSARGIDPSEATIRRFAEAYDANNDDLTLRIVEPTDDVAGEVLQMASGGGDARDVKELLRRAFCRLVMFEMHRRGIEVSVVVA